MAVVTGKTAKETSPKQQSVAPEGPLPSRVAMVQMSPILGDRQRNVELHRQYITAAKQAGADLIVFPELSLTGYFLRDIVPDVAMERTAPEIAELAALAAPAAIVAGFVEEGPGHNFYNAAFYAEGGKLVYVHRKVYLPTYGLFEEQRHFAAGRRIAAFDTERFGRVGLLVCEDLWHLSAVAVMQADEVDLLVCPINSPARGVDGPKIRTAETYERLAKAYAQLIGAAVLFVNRVGFEDGLCFWGGSMAVGPDGHTLAEAPQFEEGITIAHFDPAELRRERLITPLAKDERLLLTIEELTRIKRRRYES